MSTASSAPDVPPEREPDLVDKFGQKMMVNDINIHYVRVGKGSQPLLLMPGGTGSARTDMMPLLEGLSKTKYTLIAWDPPGYGLSRPPERDYTQGVGMFQSDSDLAVALMLKLGFSSFTVCGWSDGGRTGLVMASSYPSRVDRLVIWGALHLVTERQKRALEVSRNLNTWEPERQARFVEEYKDESQEMWSKHVNYYKSLSTILPPEKVEKIRCPTLVLHGERDAVERAHVDWLVRAIPGAQFSGYPEGTHSLHLQYPKEFCSRVTTFLDETEDDY